VILVGADLGPQRLDQQLSSEEALAQPDRGHDVGGLVVLNRGVRSHVVEDDLLLESGGKESLLEASQQLDAMDLT
jgi:hypothetical protein